MRVCHIISGDLWAGAEVMAYRLMAYLHARSGVAVFAIVLNEGKLAVELRKTGVPVEVVEENRHGFPGIVRLVRKIVARERPDLIHSHRAKENILALFSARSSGRPSLICTQHGMPEPVRRGVKLWKRRILTRCNFFVLSRYFSRVVAVSEELRGLLIREYRLDGGKILTISNGTDVPRNGSEKRARDGFFIGSAGRFFPVKDYSLMVEVAREVLKRQPDVTFRLAGEGPEEERIRRLVRDYGIERNFHLTGFLDDMGTFYEGLDLYVITSLHEGLPMSVLEAMAFGLPIVAPRCGGLGELVGNGRNGFLVEGRNPEALAEKCLLLRSDGELRRRMGKASRDRVLEEYSVEKMAGRYLDLYSRLVV